MYCLTYKFLCFKQSTLKNETILQYCFTPKLAHKFNKHIRMKKVLKVTSQAKYTRQWEILLS